MAGRKSDFTLSTKSLDDLFSTQEERDEAKLSKIYDIPLELIDDFPDHPFKVRDDEDMTQLVESIKERGVITPATVTQKEDGRYELVSGHRRKRACELAGFETLNISQLNNPKGCKFGKWATSQTDRRITDSREFKQAVSCHEELHRCACDSWNAKDNGDKEEALRHFHRALEIYARFSSAIDSLKKLLAANGDKEYTDIK